MTKKILFAASEMVPFVKTGGLGDVIGSLPIELKNKNTDTRVVIPLYKKIYKTISQEEFNYKTKFCVFNDWRNQSAEVYQLKNYEIPIYFIKNSYYFDRDGIYGYEDDYERFAFFSKALLDLLLNINFKPDIINFNDWQTGLACLYLKDFFAPENNFYKKIKSVFTIHNLQYQGIFNKNILNKILLDQKYFSIDKLEFYDQINFMKAGLLYSDAITTVSPTYSKEIQTKEYGYGLDGLLKQKNNLIGILNGLDYKKYDPQKDNNIFNFSINNLANKNLNKKKLCHDFNLDFNPKTPVISILSRFADQKGFDIIYKALKNILDLDLQLIIAGTGDHELENLFLSTQKNYINNLRVNIIFDEELAKKIYAGSDIFLMPSKFEPCGLAQIISMRYGTIPVARKTGGLIDTIIDFNLNNQTGNGFLFQEYSPDALLFAIKQAINIYKNKSLWRKIILNAMKANFSWDLSAQKYIDLYNSF